MPVTVTHVSGGVEIGGSGEVEFVHGSGQVDADLVLEWDFDNDGDFDLAEEDITGYVLAVETKVGRDFPSQLTGKAGPGQATVTLLNTDGRFSYFNAASPLNQGPNSLKVGRKLRVRTSETTSVDPTLLARDRFLGSGALGADELGHTWTARTTNVFTRETDSAQVAQAVPSLSAAPGAVGVQHIATVDVGQDDLYAQMQWRFVDPLSRVGVVYRYQDASNFGAVHVRTETTGAAIRHVSRSAGVDTTTTIAIIEYRHDDFLGVLVDGSTATVFHNGVNMGTATAHTSASNHAGIYAEWRGQRAPAIREFYVWDGLLDEVPGVIFTGDVASVMPTAGPGQLKTAQLTAVGRLERAAGLDLTPPNSIGQTGVVRGFDSPGSTAGVLVGGAAGLAGLLHPPARIDAGDVLLGAVSLAKGSVLTAMRTYEEAELGFLHETAEGGIAFHSRSARDATVSEATFTDDPTAGGQFEYKGLEPYDWKGEIVNRVEAGIAPKLARQIIFIAENSGVPDVIIPMPNLANGTEVGDLFLVVIASSIGASGVDWEIPTGWTEYRPAGDQIGKIRIYAKVVETDDIDDLVTFYATGAASGSWTSLQILVKDFYGDLQSGLAISDVTGFGQPSSVARAREGDNNPAAVFPPWAPAPSSVLVVRGGMTTVSAIDVDDPNGDDWYAPHGYTSMFTFKSATDTAMQIAFRNTNDAIIDPSGFATDPTGAFNNFEHVEVVTIAVRGFAGDPPEAGAQTVVVEDFASQESHNSVRTHSNAAQLFDNAADAEAYGQVVLGRFADDRPIFRITFDATLSAAYRAQAVGRRVGDRISLIADNDTGMGAAGDFFIESVANRVTNAGKVWEVTWELSPA